MTIEHSDDSGLKAIQGQEYKASDLLKLAGLTYRQLNDWEERAGIMSSGRATSAGWRRFSLEEVMALAICTAVRRQLSIPLENLRNLYRWLIGRKRSKLQEMQANRAKEYVKNLMADGEITSLQALEGDALREALKDEMKRFIVHEYINAKIEEQSTRPILKALKLAKLGIPVYLIGLDSPLILPESHLVHWVIGRNVMKPTVLCQINWIFNEVLVKLGRQPFGMDKYSRPFFDYWKDVQARTKVSDNERKVLDIIRRHNYQRVTVLVEGGRIVRADIEEKLANKELAAIENTIMDLIGRKEYQTVTIIEQDGKLVNLSNKTQEILE